MSDLTSSGKEPYIQLRAATGAEARARKPRDLGLLIKPLAMLAFLAGLAVAMVVTPEGFGAALSRTRLAPRSTHHPVIAVTLAIPAGGQGLGQPAQGCGGRCLNPHPGAFRSWYGQRNGCLVQVWRQWPDACTHYQWLNTCNNIWDPQINWTCCVH